MGFDTKKVAAYGTLRYGHGNWSWAFSEAPVVQLEDTVSGYVMRTHGGFPAIFEGPPDSEVVVDVFDLAQAQPEIMASVDGMEFGCGYFRRLELTNGGHEVWLYVMPPEQAERFPIDVPSGDWNLYEGGNY